MDASQFTGLSAAWQIWRFLRDPIGALCDFQQRHGDTAIIGPILPWRSRRRFIIALGPENNRAVFGDPAAFRTTGQTRNGEPNSAMRRLRSGLTAMNGAKHKQQRQFISPFFSKTRIDGYCGQLAGATQEELNHWPAGRPVNLSALLNQLMLRLSARILFGRENRERLELIGASIHETMQRNLCPLVQLFPFRFPGSPASWIKRMSEQTERVLLEMIHQRRANPVADGDLLDSLVHARDADDGRMTDADLLGEATVLFAASYETQSKVMTWTSLLLAQHPRVMDVLRREIDDALGDQPPTLDQLERLPYLDAVLKESMRILPPVPYTLRRAAANVALPRVQVNAGDWIVLSHYITHHLPSLYEHPQRFWPERWFTIEPNQYEYLPFSAGPRWCIGKPLAMKMMKIALAMLVQRWQWQLPDNVRIARRVRVTMSPQRGLPVVLHPTGASVHPVAIRGNVSHMCDWIDEEPAETLEPQFADACREPIESAA